MRATVHMTTLLALAALPALAAAAMVPVHYKPDAVAPSI